ncbi:serine/threonine protein kinase [Capronia coronata CBS 617.96]|uniref:Serine/threonine protein kinase n=1 Tax=Capronia coronata CBS 617.96 TaxID=1182541 RepID=W9YEW1_9EURO|nr:serine/threonine protein kinase [Capronia coronata CBS 617.96]EXJ88215.1 serine/threonine protein kinase [Capronia coronata CBS 617.96]
MISNRHELLSCEIIDIEQRFPSGVISIIGQGTSCFVGLVDHQTVLKYPLFPDNRFRIEVEQKSLEHVGPHPRVVESAGLTEDGLLLRYAQNGTLHNYISQQSKLSTTQLLRFCIQIAEGLMHLHSRSVYYGALRPGNILLDENLDIKLADIQGVLISNGKVVLDGLARESSMYYMPRDGDRMDTTTDLFAFGSTVHFIMTGQEVFPDLVPTAYGDDEEYENEIYRRFTDKELPDVSHPCATVTQRCWRGMYDSAEQLLMDLEALIKRLDAGTSVSVM